MGVYLGKLAGWALVTTVTSPDSGGFSPVIDQVVLKVGRSVIPGMPLMCFVVDVEPALVSRSSFFVFFSSSSLFFGLNICPSLFLFHYIIETHPSSPALAALFLIYMILNSLSSICGVFRFQNFSTQNNRDYSS